jgi:hypothetical protein
MREGCQNSDSRFVGVWQGRDLAAVSGRLASTVPVRSRLGSSYVYWFTRAREYQKPLEGARIAGRTHLRSAWTYRSMPLTFAYLAFSAVLSCSFGGRRAEFAKDVVSRRLLGCSRTGAGMDSS